MPAEAREVHATVRRAVHRRRAPPWPQAAPASAVAFDEPLEESPDDDVVVDEEPGDDVLDDEDLASLRLSVR